MTNFIKVSHAQVIMSVMDLSEAFVSLKYLMRTF